MQNEKLFFRTLKFTRTERNTFIFLHVCNHSKLSHRAKSPKPLGFVEIEKCGNDAEDSDGHVSNRHIEEKEVGVRLSHSANFQDDEDNEEVSCKKSSFRFSSEHFRQQENLICICTFKLDISNFAILLIREAQTEK